MRLPERVKIAGVVYEVNIAENRSEKDGKLLGEIVYHEGTIYLNEDQRPDIMAATFLHEVVHGVLYHMGSKLNDDEKFVEGFTSGLYQVFADNGWTFGNG